MKVTITKDKKAKIEKLQVLLDEKNAPSTVVNVKKADMKEVCEALSEQAFVPLQKEFEKVGWKVKNLVFEYANYYARPRDYEGTYEITLTEFIFSFEIEPAKDAKTLEIEVGEWKDYKVDIAETGATSTIIALSVLLGIAFFTWLSIREWRMIIQNVVASPYAHDFFSSLKNISLSILFAVAGFIFVLILLAFTGGDLKSLFTGGGKDG
jgi:hypothetical protein